MDASYYLHELYFSFKYELIVKAMSILAFVVTVHVLGWFDSE